MTPTENGGAPTAIYNVCVTIMWAVPDPRRVDASNKQIRKTDQAHGSRKQVVVMNKLPKIVASAAAVVALVASAGASDYPVTGKFTYDNPTAQGPATDCGGSTMTFGNGTRRDTVGSVPELQNKTARQIGAGEYNVVDTFYNGQTWGSVRYQMRVVDENHVQIDYDKGGSYTLRRCQ